MAKNAQKAVEKIKSGEADLYEVRLDHFSSFDGLEELEPFAPNLIFTFRSYEEGGRREASDEERLRVYKRVLELYPAYVDVGLNSGIAERVVKEAREKRVGVVLSYHNFEETPDFWELLGVVKAMEALEPDVMKIVTMARSLGDNLRIARLYEGRENVVAFCMGSLGRLSRLISALLAPFTYASLDEEAAPGQLTVEELRRAIEVVGDGR
ncbi:3-dehydroquinate dehydratase [Thermococcus sp. GR4]|uniref:3-dehydroquinate dehydratase n=1 Tax=Thermococcus sp. GR4 TaxID=1638254 RepID=UPI003744411E